MKRAELRKFTTTVLAPTRTGPGGPAGHTHEVLAGSTRTEPAAPGDHTHEIRPGADRTEPGGLDQHIHAFDLTMKRDVKRKILDGEMIFLSLVDEGANEVVPVLKGKNLQRIEAVAKLSKEGLLYNLVYGPDLVDTHGDIASKQAVQRIAHKFIPNMVGSGIDVMHNCQPVDRKDAHICESFIIQKNGDDRFKGVTIQGRVIEDTTELEGWWASIIKLNALHLRQPFESGEWTGVSMYGTALVEPVAKQFDFTQALAKRLGIPYNPLKETPMDEIKLAQAIATALSGALTPMVEKIDTLVKSVDAMTKGEEPASKTTEKRELPVFDGDPTDLEAVETYEEELFRTKLDFSNEKDLAKWKSHLIKRAEEAKKAEEAKTAEENKNPEIAKAKAEADAANRRYQELAKSSNQSTKDVDGAETDADKITRIRKTAKETAQTILRDQGRLPPLKA